MNMMSVMPTGFVSNAVLTPANLHVIDNSIVWGKQNVAQLRPMELSKSHITVIEGGFQPDAPTLKSVAVDTFKLVYAADLHAQLPRGRVNDTLARLTLMSSAQMVGREMRGLALYPYFADQFKARFRLVVKLASEIGIETYFSTGERERLAMQAFALAGSETISPDEDGSGEDLLDIALTMAHGGIISEQLDSVWGVPTQDLDDFGSSGEDPMLPLGMHIVNRNDPDVR